MLVYLMVVHVQLGFLQPALEDSGVYNQLLMGSTLKISTGGKTRADGAWAGRPLTSSESAAWPKAVSCAKSPEDLCICPFLLLFWLFTHQPYQEGSATSAATPELNVRNTKKMIMLHPSGQVQKQS